MRVNRFWLAMVAYVAIAVLAWNTLTDEKLRLATLVVLALFAVKTVVRRKDAMHPEAKADGE